MKSEVNNNHDSIGNHVSILEKCYTMSVPIKKSSQKINWINKEKSVTRRRAKSSIILVTHVILEHTVIHHVY